RRRATHRHLGPRRPGGPGPGDDHPDHGRRVGLDRPFAARGDPAARRDRGADEDREERRDVSRLAALGASAAGMRIYPGNHPSTSVATAAVAQLCAAWPGPLMEGVFAVGVSGALGADIVTDPLAPVNGEIRVP